eukprot:1811017-Rhodomonas_salina.2
MFVVKGRVCIRARQTARLVTAQVGTPIPGQTVGRLRGCPAGVHGSRYVYPPTGTGTRVLGYPGTFVRERAAHHDRTTSTR